MKYQKNIRGKENLIKKNKCTPSSPKKYSCTGLKKLMRGNVKEKKGFGVGKFPTSFQACPDSAGHFVGTSSNLEHYFTFPTFLSTFLTFKQKWSNI